MILTYLYQLKCLMFSKFNNLFNWNTGLCRVLLLVAVQGVISIQTGLGGDCALHLDGPGRHSAFDFHLNTLRGGPL